MSGIFLKSEFKDLFNKNMTTEALSVSNVLNKYMKGGVVPTSVPTPARVSNLKIDTTTINNDSATSPVNHTDAKSQLSATSSVMPTNSVMSTNGPVSKSAPVNLGTDSATSSMVDAGTQELSATSSMAPPTVQPTVQPAVQPAVQPTKVGGARQFSSLNSDVDSLVDMLTTDTVEGTGQLENKLKNLLNNKVGGGGNDDLTNVKNFFHKLKRDGVDVQLKLNDQTLSEFFNNKVGGGTRTLKSVEHKAHVKNEDSLVEDLKHSDNGALVGGRDLPPALVAFQKIRSMVAKELDLKGIKVSAKVASALKKEVAKENPKADAMEIAELSVKYFKDNKSKFEKLAKSLA